MWYVETGPQFLVLGSEHARMRVSSKSPYLIAVSVLFVLAVLTVAGSYFLRGSERLFARTIAYPVPKSAQILKCISSSGRESKACFQLQISPGEFPKLLEGRRYSALVEGSSARKIFMESTYRLFQTSLPKPDELSKFEIYESFDEVSGVFTYIIVEPSHSNVFALYVRI